MSRSYVDLTHAHSALTAAIVKCAFRVHAALGYGFLEAVYRRALGSEMRQQGLAVEQELSFDLQHRANRSAPTART